MWVEAHVVVEIVILKNYLVNKTHHNMTVGQY